MILWHVAGALFLARWVFRDPSMDLRVLVLGAVLPDLIDKPIGSILFVDHYMTGRIYGHTLLFAVAVLVAVMVVTRRGTDSRKRWMALPIGVFLHLILDMPLEAKTLWWPVLGSEFPAFARGAFVDLVAYLARSPWVVMQELLGLAYLVVLARKLRLGEPIRRRALVATGRLPL